MSSRQLNITPELQTEMFWLYQADRVSTDVFPTLQGTGMEVFFELNKRENGVHCNQVVNDRRLSSYLQDGGLFYTQAMSRVASYNKTNYLLADEFALL